MAQDTDTMTFTDGGGKISVSQIENRNGLECWIHDLDVPDGSGPLAVRLMALARRQSAQWGFEDVWANVAHPGIAKALGNHGWNLEQLIFKGKTSHGD